MLFAFEGHKEFDLDERQFLGTIARQVSLALERADLLNGVKRDRLSKDELIATLSHELRNPLASIGAINEAIKVLDDPVQRNAWQAILDRQIMHMSSLLNEMVDFYRAEHGETALPMERLDVRAVLSDAVEGVRAEIDRRGLKLRVDLGYEGVADAVMGNRTALTQVFYNLLGNSIKFTDAPGEIIVACHPAAAEQIVITFTDTGCGLEGSMLAHIFEPFRQGTVRPSEYESSLGLGLALVKRLIALHGGSVSAGSEGLGRGTTMTLVLPLAG
jgi:signal transduction histidine kinase